MAYFVLILLTLLSCVLFEYAGIPRHIQKLVASYKFQFKLMSDKGMTDEEKQRQLLRQVSCQLLLLLRLILGILLFIAPFLSLYLLKEVHPALHPGILITWWGLLLPLLAVLVYIYLKRIYVRLFKDR